jgi:predicted dehydrogenase
VVGVYKWGVIGCGNIANLFMSSLQGAGNGMVIACAARDIQRAKVFAEEYSIEYAYGDYSSLINNSDIDAVYIATTHNAHYQNVIDCLSNGKHVLCEKPLTVNAKQAERLYQIAKKKSLLLIEAVWTRFLPAIRNLQDELESGVIGEITSIDARFGITGNLDKDHRLKNIHTAGGSLLDLGIYPITIASIVLKEEPCRIQSSVVIGDTGVDERAFMLFDYPNSKHAMLQCSFSHTVVTEAVIGGTLGSICVPNFLGAQEYTIHVNDTASETKHFPYKSGHEFKAEIEEFHRCLDVKEIESNIMPSAVSISVMKIMDDLRKQWGLAYPDALESV